MMCGEMERAERVAGEALGVAGELGYGPLVGRARFWKALAEWRVGKRLDAEESAEMAVREVRGRYEEGKWARRLGGVLAEERRLDGSEGG